MNMKNIIAILFIVAILALAGCSNSDPNVVEKVDKASINNQSSTGSDTIVVETEKQDSTETANPAAPAPEAQKPAEQPKPVETAPAPAVVVVPPVNDTEVKATTTGAVRTITINSFEETYPDIAVKVGDSVQWTNKMPNIRQIIAIIAPNSDGSYGSHPMNNVKNSSVMPQGSYEYTFTAPAKYKWGSMTKFDAVYGYIIVTK
jgi:hypothetical protein